mgnify:CR=1 FL=1
MERVEIEGQYCYKARLLNLRAGETYSYRLCNRKNGAHSEVFNFTTAKQGEGVSFYLSEIPRLVPAKAYSRMEKRGRGRWRWESTFCRMQNF